MGIFDDMIAAPATAPAAPQKSGGIFDDMLQEQKGTPQQMSGDVPVQSTLQTFFQNLPKFPRALYEGLKSTLAYPGEVWQGNASVPQSANMPGGETTENIGRAFGLASTIMPLSEIGGPTKLVPPKAPTEAALEASKTSRYQSPEVVNFRFTPEAGPDVANLIRTDLKAAKLDKFNAGPYYDVADRLEKPRFGDNLTVDDFDQARQDAAAVAKPSEANANDKRAQSVIRNAIDSYLGNVPDNHVLTGNAAAMNDALLKARADTAALKRSEEVTNALGRAQNRVPAANSGRNFDNLTRQQLTPILDKKMGVSKVKGFEDYTPEELAAAIKAQNPGFLGNQARNLSNKLGGGGGAAHSLGGLFLGTAAHDFGAGTPTSILLALAGMGAGSGLRAAANKMAYGRVDALGELLRRRSALANEMQPTRQPLSPLFLRAPLLGLGATPPMPLLGVNAASL